MSKVHYRSADCQLIPLHRLSEDALESVSSDMSAISLKQPGSKSFSENSDAVRSVASTVVREVVDNERKGKRTAMRPQSSGSRCVLVKDTAFQT